MTSPNPHSSKAYFEDWTDYLTVDRTRLEALLEESHTDPRGRVRICLHRTEQDPMQEMIIALARHSFLQPLRQMGLQKSYVVLQGRLRAIFFDEEGKVLRRLDLEAGGCAVARFDASIWQTVTALSEEGVIYVETIVGPFDRSRTEWAPWASAMQPQDEIDAYVRDVLRA